ncbi:hypothetical protein FQR65_LT02838 [Abscondita terminalis]|nr:hypothetical protein FQR65_LT02838 [Abscondita terminalis]
MGTDVDVKIQVIANIKYNTSLASTIELAEEEQVFEYLRNEESIIFLVIPPDGGWGWVVVSAAFYSFLVSDGIIYAFGIFITDMAESFKCSKSHIVLVGGISTAFVSLTGPFVSALINRYGYRKIAMMGSLLSAVSCLLTADTGSLRILYLTHGVLSGVGFGMIYLPAVIAVGFYFERLRALASGIAVCGAGMGGIILPLVFTIILNEHGWRYTYIIMSILCISCVFCGYLFKPLKPTKICVQLDDCVSTATQETNKSCFCKLHNSTCPTIYEIRSKSRPNEIGVPVYGCRTISEVKVKRKIASSGEASDSKTSTFQDKIDENTSSTEFIVNRMSYCTASDSSYKNIKMTKNSAQSAITSARVTQNQLATVPEESRRNWIGSKKCLKRLSSTCAKLKTCFSKRGQAADDPVIRPIYRNDIFYSGSVIALEEYQKYASQSKCGTSAAAASKSGIEYGMAVTRTITQRELMEEKKHKICSEAFKRTLATMLDFSLMKSPTFILLVINSMLTSLGYYTPYLFIQDRSIEHGISSSISFWLISCIGITNTFGRIVCGIITSVYRVSAINTTYACLFVGGLSTSLSCLSITPWAQFSYAAVYGFSIASTSALRTIIIVDLLGLERLTNAVGILLMFQGIATLIGTASSGLLKDFTGNYQLSFHLAGGCLVLSSILLIPIKKVSEWERRRKEDNNI